MHFSSARIESVGVSGVTEQHPLNRWESRTSMPAVSGKYGDNTTRVGTHPLMKLRRQ